MMTGDISLVRVWDDPGGGDLNAWRSQGTERVLVDGGRAVRMFVNLRRTAAGIEQDDALVPGPPPWDEHLAVGPGACSTAWCSCADVIVRRDERSVSPWPALAELRAAYPGCLVVVVSSRQRGHVVAIPGARMRLVPAGGGVCADDDVLSYASAFHAWLTSGRPIGALTTARLTVMYGRAPVRPGAEVMVEDLLGRRAGPGELERGAL
ncbi:hypothetical protein [Actinomadura macra]|uniref:hypothetical protein n=1 Tax=Actinomadura macra TaxID=46164 RepID=UPI0012FCE39E|nr:hypothetical protein [Actinomadura macra]